MLVLLMFFVMTATFEKQLAENQAD
jgi:hypothetical protein